MSGKRRVTPAKAGGAPPVGMAAIKTEDFASVGDTDPREEFHRQYDISYVAPGLPRLPMKVAFRHYLASAVVYGGVLLFYLINPWFRELLALKVKVRGEVRAFPILAWYGYAYAVYLVVSPLVLFLLRPRSIWVSKNVQILGYGKRLVQWLVWPGARKDRPDWRPSYQEKHVLMFLFLKVIYGPLMIANVINYGCGFVDAWAGIHKLQALGAVPLVYWFDLGYEIFFYVVFVLDPMVSAIAYHFESAWLGNKLRCTDTNPFHMFVCLACYPPFNLMTAAVLGASYRTHMILWQGDLMHPLTWILRGGIALSLLCMLSASLSLCTRATNLTNRGIVDWGPFRLVRHPGYFSKNLYWLFTLIPFFVPNHADPGFTWPAHLLFCATLVAGFLGWGTLYFLRALTEEQFLLRDPDYVAYCRKVRYRFIPGIY